MVSTVSHNGFRRNPAARRLQPGVIPTYHVAVTGTLVILRHGESTWNQLNLFTGWHDVPLNDKGLAEGAASLRFLAMSRPHRAVKTAPNPPSAMSSKGRRPNIRAWYTEPWRVGQHQRDAWPARIRSGTQLFHVHADGFHDGIQLPMSRCAT